MSKKILFITNRLRPNTGAEAIQSTMMAKYISENCQTFVISTTEEPLDIGKSTPYFISAKPHSPAKTKVENLFSRTGRNMKLCFPDSHAGWVDAAMEKASDVISDERIDVLITRSMPASTHMIGLRLKQKFPNLKWIASLSDPLSINPYQNYLTSGLKHRMAAFEQEIFANADIVTHSNSFTIDEYSRLYPEHHDKHMVMTNMFDRNDVKKTRFICSGQGPMTLSYAGRFYGKRTPISLFKAMRMFLDTDIGLKLKIIGAGKSQKLHSLIKKYGLKSNVELMPFQEPSELVNILSSSHMLVTIDGDFSGNNIFSPSKNFDYLSMTVPILGITRKGPTAALIEETGSGYWAEPDDVEGILKLLVSHQTRVREGYEFAPNHERVMDYHAKKVMKKFCDEVSTGQFTDGG